VILVKRVGQLWRVKHIDIISGQEFEEDYDYVIVGIGHHTKPNLPKIPGESLFKGKTVLIW
jgi:cation diffusion facilitator CzcD-associated flavoprotein CzcO